MTTPEPDTTPTLSIIVPAWNEEEHIGATIRSIHASAGAAGLPYEVIVSDDASTDATARIAREHDAIVVECGARQIAASRNTGARAARGRILCFVDGDTRTSPGTIPGAVRAIESGATYGGADVLWDGAIPLWSRLLLRAILRGYRVLGLASGAFIFCTREAYDQVGGFDESIYAAEEAYFTRALRKVGRYAWVRDPVTTSGRKLRTYSAVEILGQSFMLAVRGRRGLTSRRHLDIWYADRREDPYGPERAPAREV